MIVTIQDPRQRRMTALLACLWLGVLNSYIFVKNKSEGVD